MIELIRTEINAHEQALTPHRLSVASMCRLLNVTRAAVYRPHHGQVATQIAVAESADVRREIMEVATQMPCYGYRRIVEEVSRRRSKRVNHKQVRRVMHAENLVCRRPKRFRVTTDSRHGFAVYPNLAGEMNLTGINQLWVADITYVRLPKGFCYLAAILDAFSRRVVGWSLESYLDAELTIAALWTALRTRAVSVALVHHSDRGVQYACSEYTNLLKEHSIRISMSRCGNPYDNAQAERFMRTLKEEEVYLSDYDNVIEARRSIKHFLESVYNHKRLHSALGYLPPAEFEQSLQQSTSA
jgi:transposase InsO family protein